MPDDAAARRRKPRVLCAVRETRGHADVEEDIGVGKRSAQHALCLLWPQHGCIAHRTRSAACSCYAWNLTVSDAGKSFTRCIVQLKNWAAGVAQGQRSTRSDEEGSVIKQHATKSGTD